MSKLFNGHNHRVKLEDGAFTVYEKHSEQTVLRFPEYEQAKRVASHFEQGGGFAGWTPSFFLKDPLIELEKMKNLVMGPEEEVA